MIRLFFVALFSVTLCRAAFAEIPDYTGLFEVDLDEELPSLKELKEKYDVILYDRDYDRKYDFHWNIGNVFDEIFKHTIVAYGSSSKRVPHKDEKYLMDMLNMLPQEQWQYIGPFLHTLPNIPEKILNMPGIKETKNKFPTRIAKELQDMEDLEFLSPYMYVLLIPEAWPSYYEEMDRPAKKIILVKGQTQYNPEFINKVKKLVPEENYLPGAKVDLAYESKLRTLNPSKDSLLTAADVKAFAKTIEDVENWGKKDYNILKISEAGTYIDAWERDNGKALPAQYLKTVVNPCQRLAQKIKVSGLEAEFLSVVGDKGFTLKSWAYTCDKTVRAFRISVMNPAIISAVKEYQNRVFEAASNVVDPELALQHYATLQSIGEMYKAPMEDVIEVRSEKDNLYKAFAKTLDTLVDSPLVFNY